LQLGILCVGRLKAGPEREIYARYAGRVRAMRSLGFGGLDLREIDEGRARAALARMSEEGDALLAAVAPEAALVAFDARGRAAASEEFAELLARERDKGRKALWFVIGGSEGLDERLRQRAQTTLSFGAMTLPHQLVRLLVAEQIYRALTILAGHPYHRA